MEDSLGRMHESALPTRTRKKCIDSELTLLQWSHHGEFLSNAISDFFRRGYQVDTNVTFGGERVLGVHRLLMAAFLPTFKRAIDASDGTPSELNFDCVASNVEDVNDLLEFVYTGRARVSNHRLDELSRLAKDLCFEGLSEAIADHRRTISELTLSDSQLTKVFENSDDFIPPNLKEEPTDITDVDMRGIEQQEDTEVAVKIEAPDCLLESYYDENVISVSQQELSMIPAEMCAVLIKTKQEQPNTVPKSNKSHNTYTLRCDLCDMQFDTKVDLKIHVRCTHAKSKFRLPRHTSSDQHRKVFNASPAVTSTTVVAATNNTVAAFAASGKFPCDKCDKEFTLPSTLLRHVTEFHQVKRLYQCPKCDQSFASRFWLNAHTMSKHPDKIQPNANRRRHVLQKQSTPRHVPTDTSQNRLANLLAKPLVQVAGSRLTCELCHMKFFSKMDIRIHFRCSHKTIKLFECKKCDFVTVIERRMEQHRRLVSHSTNTVIDEKFTCDQCGKEFTMASGLLRHMTRVHITNVERIQCDKCPQSFATRYNYKRHMSMKHSIFVQSETEESISEQSSYPVPDPDVECKSDDVDP